MEKTENKTEQPVEVERKSLDTSQRRQLYTIAVIVLILTGLLIGLSLPSYFGNLQVDKFEAEYTSIGISSFNDIEISGSSICFIATPEYVHQFFTHNESYAEPIQLPTDSSQGGALDLTILENGWGDILLVGRDGIIYSMSVNQSSLNYGSPTEIELFNSSNAGFNRIENSWIHDSLFIGTHNMGLGICHPEIREVHFINTTHGLPHNSINYLKVRGNYLLIGTQGGFALYDLTTEELFTWTEDDYYDILNVHTMDYYHGSQTVYVGNSDGLFIFERDGDSFAPVDGRRNTDDGLHGDEVYSLEIEEDSETLFIGTKNGISTIDIDSDEIEIKSYIDSRWLSGYKVRHMVILPSYNTIYIGTGYTADTNWIGGTIITIPFNFRETLQMVEYYINVYLVAGSVVICAGIVRIFFLHKRRYGLNLQRPEYVILDAELTSPQVDRTLRGGENNFVEFKSSFYWHYKAAEHGASKQDSISRDILPYECIETIVGFLNAEGGILLVGVSNLGEKLGLDNDFEHIMEKKDKQADRKDQFLLRIKGKMDSHELDFKYQILTKRYFPEGLDKDICVVQVKPSPEPVWINNVKGDEVLPVRNNESTIELQGRDATAYVRQHWSD